MMWPTGKVWDICHWVTYNPNTHILSRYYQNGNPRYSDELPDYYDDYYLDSEIYCPEYQWDKDAIENAINKRWGSKEWQIPTDDTGIEVEDDEVLVVFCHNVIDCMLEGTYREWREWLGRREGDDDDE